MLRTNNLIGTVKNINGREQLYNGYTESLPSHNDIRSFGHMLDTVSEISALDKSVKWTWACRALNPLGDYKLARYSSVKPKAGDLALARVKEIGNNEKIVASDNKRLRVYVGDLFVGIFGNRYATDAFEGEVVGLKDISVLTASGMIGTVKSRHRETKKPTKLSFAGFIVDGYDNIINLKDLQFRKSLHKTDIKNLIVVAGTGMNSGKTTSCVKIIKGLSEKGLRVAACKLTGSVSHRDQDEMRSAAAGAVFDFSDYGFPSTYLCSKEELVDLFHTILSDAEKINPDVIVMEIADGLLQRETAMLLQNHSIKRMIKGIVFAALNPLSALCGVEKLKAMGYDIIAVTGSMTSSPLCVREFQENSEAPVASSAGSGKELSDVVGRFIDPGEHGHEKSVAVEVRL